jgi:hypothetical protein
MKKNTLSIIAIISVFLLVRNDDIKAIPSRCSSRKPQLNHLIDSLQGNWFNIDDSTNKLAILSNHWIESYVDINEQLKQILCNINYGIRFGYGN